MQVKVEIVFDINDDIEVEDDGRCWSHLNGNSYESIKEMLEEEIARDIQSLVVKTLEIKEVK